MIFRFNVNDPETMKITGVGRPTRDHNKSSLVNAHEAFDLDPQFV